MTLSNPIIMKFLTAIIPVLLLGCSEDEDYPKFEVSSAAFGDGETIPKRHSCDGEGISPPLSFSSIPEKTETYAIIADDPDAPLDTFTHWLIWGIPGSISFIDADQNNDPLAGVLQGTNSNEELGYFPPCPPSGAGNHHYNFKVYALDTAINLKEGASRNKLKSAMDGHILGVAELMGLYKR